MKNLREMKVDDLKDIAREYTIVGAWKMTKDKLIESILKNAELNGHGDRYFDSANQVEEPETVEETVETEEEIEATEEAETEEEVTEEPETEEEIEETVGETEDAEEEITTICIKLNAPMSDELRAKLEKIISSVDMFESYEEVKPKKKAKKESKHINEITWNGETKSIKEWANELEMPWPTLYDRINRNGWTVEEAMTIPLGGRRKRGEA